MYEFQANWSRIKILRSTPRRSWCSILHDLYVKIVVYTQLTTERSEKEPFYNLYDKEIEHIPSLLSTWSLHGPVPGVFVQFIPNDQSKSSLSLCFRHWSIMWQVTTKEKRYLWDWKRMMSSSSKGLKLNATKIAFFNHLAQFDWFGNFGVNLYPNYINRKSVSSIVVRETEGPDSFARKVFELLFHRTKKNSLHCLSTKKK